MEGASPLNAKCWSLVQASRATNNSPMPSSVMLLSVCCMCELRAVLLHSNSKSLTYS